MSARVNKKMYKKTIDAAYIMWLDNMVFYLKGVKNGTEHADGKCVNIRLTLEQKAFLQKYAKQEGRTMTTQIQYMIKKAMEAEKNEH